MEGSPEIRLEAGGIKPRTSRSQANIFVPKLSSIFILANSPNCTAMPLPLSLYKSSQVCCHLKINNTINNSGPCP